MYCQIHRRLLRMDKCGSVTSNIAVLVIAVGPLLKCDSEPRWLSRYAIATGSVTARRKVIYLEPLRADWKADSRFFLS
jgi:hypothetical protein